MSRIVSTEVVRVPLSDGDWMELKSELTYGDRRVIQQKTFRSVRPDGTYDVDPTAHNLATVEAYLVAWSLKGDDDKVLDITTPDRKTAMLTTVLAEDAFLEILEAVQTHIKATAEKKKSAATSTPTLIGAI